MPKPDFLAYLDHPWVLEKLSQLSLSQQIAQLIHIPAWSNRGPTHEAETLQVIEDYGVGGICFFQGDTARQAAQTQRYQQATQVPLLISQDAEWGLAMRLSDRQAFPYAMTLGAAQDVGLIEEVGEHIGKACRELGVHINYAPVVDVNTHPDNPVIGFRSFGAVPAQVGEYAGAFARGMISQGVMPVIKHFPGHGDTALDSHLDLPTLLHDASRLEAVELYPFRELIHAGLPAVMSSHIHVPVWDDTPHRAATHSSAIIQGQLRNKLGFEGLLFTDALDMQGVRKYASAAEVNLRALLAGHDVLLFCVDVPGTIALVEKAVEEGRITEEAIRQHCLKNLAAKYAYIEKKRESKPLQSSRGTLLQEVGRKALHWVKGNMQEWPSKEETAWVFLDISQKNENELKHHQLTSTGVENRSDIMLQDIQANIPAYRLSANTDEEEWKVKRAQCAQHKHLIVWLEGIGLKAKGQFGITEQVSARLTKWSQSQDLHFVVPASPYSIPHLGIEPHAKSILLTYQDHPAIRDAVAWKIQQAYNAR
ncbi:MAG: glycoside hydrolase family 3 N-terminal domain-containing protein [Bacteroidota bacterium]